MALLEVCDCTVGRNADLVRRCHMAYIYRPSPRREAAWCTAIAQADGAVYQV